MHTIIRWLMRNILLLLSEEWENARQEMREMQAVHKIRTLCHAELHILRIELAELERLHMEARRATSRIPLAQPLIAEMLRERTQQLIYTIDEQASHKRTTK
jgi:hypothetical protein